MKISVLTLFVICFTGIINAQKTVSGTVFNDSIPLIAASIQIKNTTEGIATDNKGNFEIETKIGDTLLISYIGLNTKELVVDSKDELIVNLKGSYVLDEVIIVGYEVSRNASCKIACGTYITRCGVECLTVINEKLENARNQLIFPNPSPNGMFNLNLIKDYKVLKVRIVDINGRRINDKNYAYPNKELKIDLSNNASGIYIVNILADGKRMPAQKVIKI